MSVISNKIQNELNEKTNSSKQLDNLLKQPTIHDLILFKEDILKELKNYKTKITNSVNIEFKKYSQLLEKAEQKLDYYENDKNAFMSRLDFVHEKEKLVIEVENKTSKLVNDVMLNQLHITACRKDIDNSCFKYDKIISNNLLVPGLIGTSCKFQNLKEYILSNNEEINKVYSGQRQNSNEISLLKRKVETISGQLTTKTKSLEYRLSNYMTSKYHELDDKFDRLYDELNKNMNSLHHAVTSNLEERNNEIARLKNFVLEENNKNIENVKAIKNDMINEFNSMKTNFKNIKKNIVSLTNLLMGRTYNMNKQLVISNFNNMMLDLFKEFSSEMNLEKSENKNNEVSEVKKNSKPSVDSCIKKYIEGKITVKEAKFHADKKVLAPKKSVQLNVKTLFDFNKDKALNSINNNNNNINDNKNNNVNSNNNNNIENSKNKFHKKLSQIILSPTINFYKKRSFSEHKKKREDIDKEKNKDDFKIEIKNNNINTNKKINNNDVINEEDSNKYSSKTINSNSIKEKNEKSEKRKTQYSLDKPKALNLISDDKKKSGKRNTTIINIKNGLNTNDIPKKKDKQVELSENSSSSSLTQSLIQLENSTENPDIKNLNINKNEDGINSPIKPKYYRKSYSKDLKIVNNYNFNKIITISENKEENNKHKDNKKDENNFNNNFKEIISYKEYKIQKPINFNITNNIKNKVMIDSISMKLRKNYLNQSIKKESNDNFSYLSKRNNKGKINLKKNYNLAKFNSLYNNDNFIFNNNLAKSQYDGFQINSNKTFNNTQRYNSPSTNKNKQNKDNNKITISTNNDFTITSKNLNYINKALPSISKETLINISSRNQNLYTNDRNEHLASFEKQKYKKNKMRNKSSNNNDIIPMEKLSQRIKLLEAKLNNKNHLKEDNDIYISKETAKNTRYIKDEDIIDRPLLYDMNIFKVEQKKGNLENRLMELEYFTKKKLDELVKEIKIFIPIHFNSYIKNYTVEKNQ